MTALFTGKPLLFLAPLAGYTDQAYRTVCKHWGAEVMVSEMVSADGLIRDSAHTIQYITFSAGERPFGIQIFGSDPLIMAKAIELLIPHNPDFVDINMGCPVKKVIRRGAGSALMQNPALASSIVKECRRVLAGTIPLSVKFRSGWDANSLNYLDFGLLLQDSGADFLCLHPRTAKQMFSGTSNWQHIAHLKTRLSIPLIGNGDIASPEAALKMLEETHCDGLMIGRAALGRPWLFSQCRQYLSAGYYSPLTRDMLWEAVDLHLQEALIYKPERVVIREMRSQLCFYIKGMLGAPEFRHRINHTASIQELKDILQEARHMHL